MEENARNRRPIGLESRHLPYYEKVVCRLKQAQGMSDVFESNMGVKQGCPLSPTLFGICIDQLEELINEFATKQGLQGPQLGLWTVLLLLYANDVALLAYDPDSMHKLLQVRKTFCRESGLQVNVGKKKMMALCTISQNIPLSPLMDRLLSTLAPSNA